VMGKKVTAKPVQKINNTTVEIKICHPQSPTRHLNLPTRGVWCGKLVGERRRGGWLVNTGGVSRPPPEEPTEPTNRICTRVWNSRLPWRADNTK
jgi:hypothetical protein